MTHGHLSFDLSYSFKCNADNDQQRISAERDASERTAGNDVDNKRYNSDDAEEERTDKCDLVKNLLNEISGRLTGTDTHNGSAVLLKIVSNFNRVEGDSNVEVSEHDDEEKVYKSVYDAFGGEENVNELSKPTVLCVGDELHNSCGQRAD